LCLGFELLVEFIAPGLVPFQVPGLGLLLLIAFALLGRIVKTESLRG